MTGKHDFLLLCYFAISQSVAEMKENVTNPDVVHALSMYGLGLIDAICFYDGEFKEYRLAALDKDDNDVQAFVCAAKAFHDWMVSKDLIPTDFVSDAVTS